MSLSPNPLDDEKNYLKRILEKSAIPYETSPSSQRKRRTKKSSASAKTNKRIETSESHAKKSTSSVSVIAKSAPEVNLPPVKYLLRNRVVRYDKPSDTMSTLSKNPSKGSTSDNSVQSFDSQESSASQDSIEIISDSPYLSSVVSSGETGGKMAHSSLQTDSPLDDLSKDKKTSASSLHDAKNSVIVASQSDSVLRDSKAALRGAERLTAQNSSGDGIVESQRDEVTTKTNEVIEIKSKSTSDDDDLIIEIPEQEPDQPELCESNEKTNNLTVERAAAPVNSQKKRRGRKKRSSEKQNLLNQQNDVTGSIPNETLNESADKNEDELERKRKERELQTERRKKRAREYEIFMEIKRREREVYRKQREKEREAMRKAKELEMDAEEKERIAIEQKRDADRKRRRMKRVKIEKERKAEQEIKEEEAVTNVRIRKQSQTRPKKKVGKSNDEVQEESVSPRGRRKKKTEDEDDEKSDDFKVTLGKHSIYKCLPEALKGPAEKRSFNFEYIRDNIQRIPRPRHCRSSSDDVATCGCVHIEGEVDCGSGCINRQLCIECTPGFCNCPGCTNMVFQQHKYVSVMPYKTDDARGYGLITLEDIENEQFIIEYVGEVIDKEEKARRISNAPSGSHFYIMQIGPDVFVDASRRGNFSRFMNHCCEPNCVPVKWTVCGKTRIGIFALRFIHAGEELTFDYRFQREGSKKQKCFCGAPHCKGYIG